MYELFSKDGSLSNSSKNIETLIIDGILIDDQDRIKAHLKEFYSQLYTKDFTQIPILSNPNLKRLDSTAANRIK